MAVSHQSSVQDQMADVTECCICTDVYTNPKILPCVHTFCLKCLEKYGTEKKTGDKMACPICRGEFLIPDGGLCSLPNNFFIDKMVEIRKFSEATTIDARCGICPDEEGIMAEMFCLECQLNLCERCVAAHKKIKLCQNHPVVEIGTKLKPQEVTFRNNYCDQHPGEHVKMYCEDDKSTICFICFAESHQSHKCLSVTKAAEEFSSTMKNDLQAVLGKLPEIKTALQKCYTLEKDMLSQFAAADLQIFGEAFSLKAMIDSHANMLINELTALKDRKLKEINSMKEDVEMFKATLESFAKYSEEVLSKGTHGDICREAELLKIRARELETLTENFSGRSLKCDDIIFQSRNLDEVLRVNNIANTIGDVLLSDSVMDRVAQTITSHAVKREMKQETQGLSEDLSHRKLHNNIERISDDLRQNKERISETLRDLKPHQMTLIRAKEFRKNLSEEIPDLEFEVKETEVSLRGMPEAVKAAALYVNLLGRFIVPVYDSFEISELMGKVFAKDEAKPYLLKQLSNSKVSAFWMCNDSSVNVFALDDENLKQAIDILKCEVVEARLSFCVAKLPQNFDQTHKWKDYIRFLCEEDKLLEIDVKDSIIIACAINSIEENKARIERFIYRNTLHPKGLFRGIEIKFSWRYHKPM